jgi:hypothetical protein
MRPGAHLRRGDPFDPEIMPPASVCHKSPPDLGIQAIADLFTGRKRVSTTSKVLASVVLAYGRVPPAMSGPMTWVLYQHGVSCALLHHIEACSCSMICSSRPATTVFCGVANTQGRLLNCTSQHFSLISLFFIKKST